MSFKKQWFSAHYFVNDLFAGIMSAMMMLLLTISLASLICGATLVTHLNQFIAVSLASSVITAVIYAVWSSFPTVGVSAQDTPALLAALLASALYSVHHTSDNHYFATVFMGMLLISFSGGLLMLLLGYLKQGNIVRFVPYPVIGGFLAGMGWLIFLGVWPIITGQSLTVTLLPALLQFQYSIHLLPALLLALTLLYLNRRYSHPLIIPAVTLGFIIIFFIIYFIGKYQGVPVTTWNLFLGPFPSTSGIWPWPKWEMITAVDWSLLWREWDKMVLIFILAPIAILINSASVEVIMHQEANFDRELKVSGIAGICGPFLGGGAWGYTSVTLSSLNQKLGGRHRIINIIAALACVVVMYMGTAVLNNIPRFLAPGILFFIALDFLIEWLYQPYFTLSKKDYSIIILIFLTIVNFQLIYGIALGIIISLFKFAWEYSQVDPIDGIYYGESLTSHVVRGYDEAHLLDMHGSEVCLVRLHGHLFFGNVYRVFQRIQRLLSQKHNQCGMRYLIFDFSAVDGVDSSCRNAIYTFMYKAHEKNITVLTVGLFHGALPTADKELLGSGLQEELDYEDVNDALDWCEQKLLTNYLGKNYESKVAINELQKELALSDEEFSILLSFWEGPKTVPAGEIILHQRDTDRDVYFLVRGVLAVKKNIKKRVSFVNIHAGSVFGEVAYYTGQARIADVECVTECDLYCLPADQFQRLEEDYPKIALRLHRYIARQMTENIKYVNQLLQTMLHRH